MVTFLEAVEEVVFWIPVITDKVVLTIAEFVVFDEFCIIILVVEFNGVVVSVLVVFVVSVLVVFVEIMHVPFYVSL